MARRRRPLDRQRRKPRRLPRPPRPDPRRPDRPQPGRTSITRQYASAGAVVVTTDITEPRTLLLDQIRATGERQTVAPKGRLEPGEAPLAAAIREVGEEAGLDNLAYAGYVGQEAYQFTDNDGSPATKTVDWFLLAADSTATTAREAEGFTSTRWLPLDQAAYAASHPGFVAYLCRAADLIAWRRTAPLPFSATLDGIVRDVADSARRLLDGYGAAGVAVCGSTARGDFVDGWSEVDFIGYGLPADSPVVESLIALVQEAAGRHAVRASLHLADGQGHDVRGAGPLYDMKLQAVLRRIGIDAAVIAGVAPTTASPTLDRAGILNSLAVLRDFAAERLATPAADPAARNDRARRTLSVTCSAARTVALAINPTANLRLPAVTDLLARHHPDALIGPLLGEYDTFRRHGARDLDRAEYLAQQAPDVIDDLIQHSHAPTHSRG